MSLYIYLFHNLIQYLILIEMKNLSEDLKWRVGFYISDGYNQKETAERLYISIGTVNKVYNIGCIIDLFCKNQSKKKHSIHMI